MLWKNRRASGNVIDRRGIGGGIGIGGLVIGAIIYSLMGGNPVDYLAMNAGQVAQRQEAPGAESDEQAQFASVVLADTEDVWNEIFQASGEGYPEPKLVLFSGAVRSACGSASSAIGPFYCPGDQQVYIDLGFFRQLSSELGASGDFAAAYVIAHEVGHHVQNVLGIEKQIRSHQQGASAAEKNKLSVRMELQADCFAGVWARRTEDAKSVLEKGDLEEALQAAAAVGDDRLQKASRGEVMPDSFTHGTSAQRAEAFRTGYSSGNPTDC